MPPAPHIPKLAALRTVYGVFAPAVNTLYWHTVCLDVIVANAKALAVAAFSDHLPCASHDLQQQHEQREQQQQQQEGWSEQCMYNSRAQVCNFLSLHTYGMYALV